MTGRGIIDKFSPRRRPMVEPLEDRRLLSASFTITPKAGSSFDFGSVTQNSAATVGSFILKNTGTIDEIVDAESIEDAGFKIEAGLSGQTLVAGDTLQLDVSFATDQPGPKSAKLSLFVSDDPNASGNSPADFVVTGYVTPKDQTDLKAITSTTKTASGTVDVSRGADSIGFFVASVHESTLKFGLAGMVNNLTLGVTATDVPNPDDDQHVPGDVQVILSRDANGNGLLDRSEYNQSLLAGGSPMVVSNTAGRQQLTANGLGAGTYFVNLAPINGSSGDAIPLAVHYDVDLTSAVVAPADIRVTGMGTAITDGDATAASTDGTDFGFVGAGAAGPTHSFLVTNTGGQTLTLGAVSATNGFQVVSGLPATLAPGASASFGVQFTATAAGSYTGAVSFTTNAAGKSPFNFSIKGVVAPTALPGISVSMGQIAVTDGQTNGVDFGTASLQSTPIARTFTVQNTGSAALTLGAITVPQGFVLAKPLTTTINPGQSDTFQLLLSTATAGDYFGTVSFTTNIAGQGTFDFPVMGTVSPVVSGDPTPSVMVSTDSGPITAGQTAAVNFGSATPGSPAPTKTFTVTNTGDAALTLGTPVMPAGFTLAEPLSPSLAPGTSDTFTVSMSTAAVGSFSGAISVLTNDPGVPQFDFAVSGAVTTAPPVAISAVTASGFATTIVGGTKAAKGKLTVVITNNSADLQKGPAVVTLYASSDGLADSLDGVIGTATKTLKLKPGQSKTLKLKAVVGAPPADGDYFLLASATFNTAAAGTMPASALVRIEKPRVTLNGASVGAAAQSFKAGGKATLVLPLINNGNVPAKGKITIDLLVSSDGSTDASKSAVLVSLAGLKASINAGATKTIKAKFVFPASLPAGFDPNNFVLVARLASTTVPGGNTTDGEVLTTIPGTIVL